MMILLVLLMFPIAGASFLPVKARTIGGDDLRFPNDALEQGPALFALAMGTSRESGEIQQDHLLAWQRYIANSSSPLRALPIYHFPVIEAPGFVHGLIRRGIAKSYEDHVADNQAAVLFIQDTNEFAEIAAIPIDDRATMAYVLSDGTIAGFVKGEPSAESLRELERITRF